MSQPGQRMHRHQHQVPPQNGLLTDYPRTPQSAAELDDLYWYVANFGTLAGNGTAQKQVIIQADSKFEWLKTTAWGFKDGTTPTLTDALPISIFITDTGSGRQLMSEAIPLPALAGLGELPYILPVTRIFQPNAQIQVAATNLSASQYDFVYVVFHGRKVFRQN